MLSMTRTQVQNLMTSRGLIPHEIYQITDALAGQGLVRIMATSNNTFAPRPVIPTIQGASYDLEEYAIQTDKLMAIDSISCVVRCVGGVWNFIQDAGHEPRRVSNVVTEGNNIVVNYAKTYTKVLGSQVTVDETYSASALGITCGASVGLNRSIIQLHRTVLQANGLSKVPLTPAQSSIPGSNIWFSANCMKIFG